MQPNEPNNYNMIINKISILIVVILQLFPFILNGQKIIFTPQWSAQAQFAGFYIAKEKGFYDELGLDVEIVHNPSSTSSYMSLEKGTTNIITAQLIDAILAKDKGLDLINIMQLTQNSAIAIVYRPEYTSIEQLQGKKVAVWKTAFSTLIKCFFKEKNIDVKYIPFLGGTNVFLSGAVDATSAMKYNEVYKLIYSGNRITEDNIIYLSDYENFNIPEDGLYCLRKDFEENKDAYLKFVKASIKGWEYVKNNMQESLDITINIMKKERTAANIHSQQSLLDNYLPLFVNKYTGETTYKLREKDFYKAHDLMVGNKLIKNKIDYSTFVPQE